MKIFEDGQLKEQPISAVTLPLPTGAATQTTLAAILTELGDKLESIDRDIDSISSALATDVIMHNNTALTPKFAVISATTDNGNNTIVAAVAGYKIRVLAGVLVSDADDTDIRWESGAGGTALSGRVPLKESTGYIMPFCPVGHFETDDGEDELLNLEITGTGNVYGYITYVLIPD